MEGLVKRYEQSISEGRPAYYDVDELEDLSDYYLTNGKSQESGAVIELGLRLHPNNSILLLRRATLYVEIGEYQHALHILDRLPEKGDTDVVLLRAEIYLHVNRKREGLGLLKNLMQEDMSDKVQLCLDIVSIFSEMDWYDMAIEYLLDTLKDFDNSLELLEELAWCHEQKKSYEKAIHVYERMLDIDPYKAETWFNLGQAWFNLEDYNKAVDAYDYSLTINPDDLLARMQKAHALFQGNRYMEAAKAYQEYMEEDEVSDYLLVFLGESYEKAGLFDEAMKHYAEAYRLNVENSDACTGMAICLMEKKEYQQSMSWFDKALKINDEDPEIWVYIAELLLMMDMRDEAYVSYLRSLTLKKDQPDVLAAMGNISFDNEDYEKALGLYLVASSIDPDVPGLNLFFALTYARLGMNDVSAEYLAKAIVSDPNAERLYNEILSEDNTGTIDPVKPTNHA